MLINVEMPTTVAILTFMSTIFFFIMLINFKIPAIVVILTMMSTINFTVDHEKGVITLDYFGALLYFGQYMRLRLR